jgi:hypothetical protein
MRTMMIVIDCESHPIALVSQVSTYAVSGVPVVVTGVNCASASAGTRSAVPNDAKTDFFINNF